MKRFIWAVVLSVGFVVGLVAGCRAMPPPEQRPDVPTTSAPRR